MKKLVWWFIVLLLFPVLASGEFADGYVYDKENSDDHVVLVEYTGDETEIVIPQTLAGLPVTKIAGALFKDNPKITSVVMQDNIYECYVGEVFQGCTSLKTVRLSKNLEILKESFFKGCRSLESIEIPEACTYLAGECFRGCSSLKSVKLNDSLAQIGGYVFFDCDSLTEITFPDSLTKIGSRAFGAEAPHQFHIEKFILPDHIETLEYDAFPGLDESIDVTWKLFCNKSSDTAKYVSAYRKDVVANPHCCDFFDETVGEDLALRWDMDDPDLKDEFGPVLCVASYVGKGGNVEIPAGIQKINGSAFQNEVLVTGVSFSEGLLRIDDTAFYGTGIKEVKFPASLRLLGNYSFSHCSSLHTVDLESVTQIAAIPMYCFHNSTSLAEILLPESIRIIGEFAFAGCCGFTGLPEMNGVTYIAERAFEGCAGLGTAVLPESLGKTSLGKAVFANCSNLKHVYLPDNPDFTELPEEAFSGCKSMINIDLKHVSEYGAKVFWGCSSLICLVIPPETVSLPSGFAQYCGALKAVQIPRKFCFIENDSFTTDSGYNFTIFGVKDSLAQAWANKYKNVTFRLIDSEEVYLFGPDKWNTRNCFVGDEFNLNDEYVIMPKTEGQTYTVTCEVKDPTVAKVTENTLSCLKPGVTKIVAKVGNSTWEYTMHVYARVKSFDLPPVIYIGDNYFFKTYDKDMKEVKKVVMENIIPSKDYFPAFQYEITFEGWNDNNPVFTGTTNDGQIYISTLEYKGGYGKLKVTTQNGYTKSADLVIYNTVDRIEIKHPTINDVVMVGEEVFIDAEITLSVWNSETDKSTDTVVCRGEEWLYFVPRWRDFGYLPEMDQLMEFTDSNRFIAKAPGEAFLPVVDVTIKGEKKFASFIIEDGEREIMKLPANLETIQDNAFANTSFEWLRVGDHCQYIGHGAFAGSTNLERVYLPRTVEEIEDDAFGERTDIIIYGKSHSYAEKYAHQKGMPFRFD